jgi:hypothetical protein
MVAGIAGAAAVAAAVAVVVGMRQSSSRSRVRDGRCWSEEVRQVAKSFGLLDRSSPAGLKGVLMWTGQCEWSQ